MFASPIHCFSSLDIVDLYSIGRLIINKIVLKGDYHNKDSIHVVIGVRQNFLSWHINNFLRSIPREVNKFLIREEGVRC